MSIPDKEMGEIKALGNQAIHEIVFMLHHAEDDQPADAQECLTAAALNLDQVSDLIATHQDQG